MRELTFCGYLSNYVRQLSACNSLNMAKLAVEAGTNNPRLQAPLLLYALFSGKTDLLMNSVGSEDLLIQYNAILNNGSAEAVLNMLQYESKELPAEYHKVWRSFLYEKNRNETDNHTKELMRQKIKRMQAVCGVSNYRIYKDLGLNAGNLNAWLKHGDANKVSLETARAALAYIENTLRTMPVGV